VVRQRVGRWSVPRVEERPHTKQTARAAFYCGFIERIGARLKQAHDEAVSQAAAQQRPTADGTVVSSAGLSAEVVLRDKTEEIAAFYQGESKARGSWTGYRGAAGGDTGAATSAGRRAAAQARLGSQRGIGESGAALEG